MYLTCKCGIKLTKDLCLTSGSNLYAYPTGPCEEDYDMVFKPGFFTVVPAEPVSGYKWHSDYPLRIVKREPQKIRVAKADLIIPVPLMPAGYGCCDWSFGHQLKCSCGTAVGEMYFDCYEDKYINFIGSNVIRRYL